MMCDELGDVGVNERNGAFCNGRVVYRQAAEGCTDKQRVSSVDLSPQSASFL